MIAAAVDLFLLMQLCCGCCGSVELFDCVLFLLLIEVIAFGNVVEEVSANKYLSNECGSDQNPQKRILRNT